MGTPNVLLYTSEPTAGKEGDRVVLCMHLITLNALTARDDDSVERNSDDHDSRIKDYEGYEGLAATGRLKTIQQQFVDDDRGIAALQERRIKGTDWMDTAEFYNFNNGKIAVGTTDVR